VFGPEMKTVERGEFSAQQYQQERARYLTQSRSHQEQFDAHANGQACTQCHLEGKVTSATAQKSARTFWHALHVTPGSLAAADAPGRTDCVSCHNDLTGDDANKLTPASAGAYHWPDTSSAQAACSECHKEGQTGLTLVAANTEAPASARPVADFPHNRHLNSDSYGKSGTLQQGCFACHYFSEAPADAPFSQVPRTKEGAANCADCHGGHDNIAGGDCQKCHPKLAGKSNSFLRQAKITSPAGMASAKRLQPLVSWPQGQRLHLVPHGSGRRRQRHHAG
jgi:hypothetical protein